jgi:hypothetical protein
MKKIVLSTVISLGLAVNALGNNDAISKGKEIFCKNFNKQHTKEFCEKAFDNKNSNSEVNGFIAGVASVTYMTAETIIDYFQSKTCKEDFTSTVSIEDIKHFLQEEPQFNFLTAMKALDQNAYDKVIGNYKFINCGIGEYKSIELEELKEKVMTEAEK